MNVLPPKEKGIGSESQGFVYSVTRSHGLSAVAMMVEGPSDAGDSSGAMLIAPPLPQRK